MLSTSVENLPNKAKRKTLGYIIAITILITLIVVMTLLKNSVALSEWWVMNISRLWTLMASGVSSFVPFSLFEWGIVLTIVIVLMSIIALIAMLVTKRYHKATNALLAFIVAILCVVNIYTTTAGFSYTRAELPLDYYSEDITHEMLIDMAKFYVEDMNQLSKKFSRDQNGDIISPYTKDETAKLISEEMKKLDSDYFYSHSAKAKPLVNSWFFTESRISGISFMPTGEAHYNYQMHQQDKPITIAHELAHQKGVMREGDATTVAEYILLSSQNEYLRYCGYFDMIHYLSLSILRYTSPITDKYSKYVDNVLVESDFDKWHQSNIPALDSAIDKEISNAYDFWLNAPATFLNISSAFNDMYLKISGLSNGTADYDNGGSHVGSGDFDANGQEIFIYKLSKADRMYYLLYSSAAK